MWARGLNDEIIVWRYFHCDHPPGERTASELQKQTYRWALRASKTNAQMGPTSFRNKRTEGPYELQKETHRWALRASVKRIDGGSLIVWPSFLLHITMAFPLPWLNDKNTLVTSLMIINPHPIWPSCNGIACRLFHWYSIYKMSFKKTEWKYKINCCNCFYI